jgi:amino acid permease
MADIRGATSVSSIINTVNTIIGSGILVLPYAFRTDSIFLGTIIILLAGIANGLGMILQGAASKFLPPGTATFFTVCRITYPKLSVLFDFAIFLQCFGVNISYLVLTGDLLPLVYSFDNWNLNDMKVFYILCSTLLIVPLCLTKRIDSLKYASVIALIAIIYICFLIYGYFIITLSSGYTNIPNDKIGEISLFIPQGIKPVFKTLGVVVLAYTCPTQFSIVSELENPSIQRISRIVYISMIITASIFVSVSFAGYLTFGNALTGNILLMYGNNIYTQTGRALLVLMIVLSFPLMFHPARVSFNNVYYVISEKWIKKDQIQQSSFHTCSNHHHQREETDELFTFRSPLLQTQASTTSLASLENAEQILHMDDEDVEMSNIRFYTLSFLLLILSYLSALLLNSFELILSVVGSTGGVLISFVLPGFYGYKLIASNNDEIIQRLYRYSPNEAENPIFYSKLLKKISLLLIIWGIAVMIICLYSILFA